MSTKHREEVINTFQNICQCSREIAQELLTATDWNEEAALEIFLDSNSGNQSLDPVGTVNTQPYEREPTHQSSGLYSYTCYGNIIRELRFVFHMYRENFHLHIE